MHHHTELSFVDEFRWVLPLHYLKNGWQNAVLRWCMLQAGPPIYTTTAPSCCIPASYYHMSATLQTMRITFVNFQDNRVVFRIFIALLRFSFDPPSYLPVNATTTNISQYDSCSFRSCMSVWLSGLCLFFYVISVSLAVSPADVMNHPFLLYKIDTKQIH